MIAPVLTVAERNPLNPLVAFLYFATSQPGSSGSGFSYTVSGIPGAFVSERDDIRHRFVINNITNPSTLPNVRIIVTSIGQQATSNPVTVPCIL